MNMAFGKEERSCRTLPGLRLATVEEAKDNLDSIKPLLNERDRARLLDGWIGGSAYDFNVQVGFRSCLGYMLVIKSPTLEIFNTDDRNGVIYSDVPKLSKEAWNAASLLCCEDWNKDVLYRLIQEETKDGRTREDAIWEGGEIEVASKLVSTIAREWQNVHAKWEEQRTGFSFASLEDLRIGIQEFLKGLAVDTEKSLKDLMDQNQNSEQGRITNNILEEQFRKIQKVGDNVFENIGWTEDLIKDFTLDTSPPSPWEVIADTVSYITVDATVHVTTTDLCSKLYYKVVRRSSQAGTQTMDDCSVPASVIRYAYDIFDKNLSKLVKEAGREAKGDCKRFCQILRDQWLRKSSCESEFDGLRTVLVRAAKEGNVDLVKILSDRGVELAAKDKNGQTALHHAFRGKQPNEKLVQVLIEAEKGKSVDGSARVVDVEDNEGKTPLDLAIKSDTNVNMVAWLLSLSSRPQSYFKNLHLSLYLRESSRMGYEDLVEKLLDEEADPFDPDDEGKTALHCAVEGQNDDAAWEITRKLLEGAKNAEKASAGDKYGRTALHVAAFLGREKLCSLLFQLNRNVDTEDHDGQRAIHYAVARAHNDIRVLNTILTEQGTNHVFVKDFSQTTPLHVAASRGNQKMVEELLSKISEEERRKKYVEAPDVFGQTALHKAASGGHWKIVEILLKEGAHPLKERDCDRKTALHFAAEAGGEDAVRIAKLLLGNCESAEQKILLLYASAVGIGFPNSSLESYLEKKKYSLLAEIPEKNLLRVAAILGDIDMAREFIARGANIALIRNEQWREKLDEEQNKNVEDVLKKIEKIVEQGTDKPSQQDNLGRTPFAIGLAALFLNPFVKSPITVGISGEWGTGKSSVMMQTESILVKTAAQLAFSQSFQEEKIPGASESKLSVTGQARLNKIANEIERLSGKRQDGHNIIEKIGMSINRLMNFTEKAGDTQNSSRSPDFLLQNYQPKYHQIFKSLAIMDRCDMFEKEEESRSGNQNVGVMPWDEDPIHGTPHSILTVRYNAWHYTNETEAWAGLAVEITKELEATMTVAHRLRTNWIYNWRNQKNNICFGVLLPYFLTVLLTIFFTIIGWLLLDTAQNKDIRKVKYGCLPVSMIVIAWSIGKSLISMVKPISSQVLDYICLPDHRHKLGYHHQVISDINFLKAELHYRPSLLWKAFACIWCFITLSRNENYVPGTKIPKIPSAFGNNLRIIVFVDDLDRCEENVILRVLSAVHLVLATCEINVILSMENSMIKKAIMRKYGKGNGKASTSNEDFAEKYLRKIVQLPLHIPDPSDSESREFLQSQLGPWDPKKESAHPAVETERTSTHVRRKANPKFQIETPWRPQLARGETRGHSGAEQQSDDSFSDRVQQSLGNTEQPEISEHPEGSRVEAKIEIPDQTTGIEQPQNTTEQGEIQPMRAGDQDRQSEQSLKDLSLIISRMLIPMYTEGEKNAFHFLHARSTRNKKIPREWKCFMTYHRLAWNILSLGPDIIPLEGWQIQLIAWIFVCWQWSNLITTLIQKWNNLGVLRKWKVTEEHSGPSLREIVEHYIDERWPVNKRSDNFQGDVAIKKKGDAIDSPSSTEEVGKTSDILPEKNMTTICSEEDTKGVDHLTQALRKVLEEQEEIRAKSLKEQEEIREKSLKAQAEMRNVLKILMKKVFDEDIFIEEEEDEEERSVELYKTDEEKQKSEKVKDEEEREEWSKLKETLRHYNVSMDGILAFQKFRFYCEPGYLQWPLPKQA